MTNLLEKSLITGFGIFALILFLILITPFFQEIEEYKENEGDDLDEYTNFIDKVNSAIIYFINYPRMEYLEKIEYPENINVTFKDNYAIFDFLVEEKVYSKILKYDDQFILKNYCNVPPKTYQLTITRNSSLINIDFNNLD